MLVLLALTALPYLTPERSFAAQYTRQEVPNAWTTPPRPGETAMDCRSDDLACVYSLPFAFPFFGATYNTIWASTNGMITMTQPVFPYFTNGVAALRNITGVAVLWDDLRTDNDTSTDIFTSQPDSNHVLVRWKAVTFADASVEVNFEALLGLEGTIRFNYGPNTGPITATVGISDGLGAVIASDIGSSNFVNSILFTKAPGSPTASFTYSPVSPRVGTIVTFDASASRDDGFIASYNWTFGDGSPPVVEADPITNYTYTLVGLFNVILRVTDNDGNTSEATQSIRVTTTGLSPLARFTATPARALLGHPITFNASASSDPDGGQIVNYHWTFGDGSNGTGRIVTHLYASAGIFLVRLTVTDDEGSVSSIENSVTVFNADVRLLDTYAQFRVLKLRQNTQVIFYAETINVGNTPVFALVRFRVFDLKTGTSSTFSSNSAPLNVRDQYLFQLDYSPPLATTRYLVLVTVFLSEEDLPRDSPQWSAVSLEAALAFRVIQ